MPALRYPTAFAAAMAAARMRSRTAGLNDAHGLSSIAF